MDNILDCSKSLYRRLEHFINDARYVSIDQLYCIFKYISNAPESSLLDKETVNFQLEKLLNDAKIMQDKDGFFLPKAVLLHPKSLSKTALYYCLWVVCGYNYDEISELCTSISFPYQVSYIDKDENVYQLIYVCEANFNAISLIINDLDKSNTWEKFDKPITKIAVVQNEELGSKVKEIDYFDYCAVVQETDETPEIAYI